MTERMERKDIEREDEKAMGNPNFGGRSNWDTYDTVLIIDSNESTQRLSENLAKDFNRRLRNGTFDMEKAQEAVRKYLVKEAVKGDPEIDPSKVNTREIVRDMILNEEPLPPRKVDYKPSGYDRHNEYDMKEICDSKHMEFVPGYEKTDGTWVSGYCRHTAFTKIMRKYERR